MIDNFYYFAIIFISFYLGRYFNVKIKNYDLPGNDKVHEEKVITSGGLLPLLSISILICYFIFFKNYNSNYYNNIPQLWIAPLAILILTLISFLDDINYIPYQFRLISQIVVVFFCISLFPINFTYHFQTPIFNGLLPVKLDVILTIFFWIFIINSSNFIDGYDGMYSFQTVTTFFGLGVIFFLLDETFHLQISILLLLAGIIFLPFNLNKKQKLFIGDTGSIPTGFILGWLLISLANMGYLLSAILINLFFILDIAITLIIRILQRKSIFIRHNDFFFKKIIFKKGPKNYFIVSFIIQIILIAISIFLITI